MAEEIPVCVIIHGVSPEEGRESKLGRICEKCRFYAGSERVREL